MTNDRSTDDDGDEYWQRVHDADAETRVDPASGDPRVKTDPDEVRGWAEERDAVPVSDPEVDGPEAYALRHETVVDGSAHEKVSWADFAAAFRGETDDEGMEFHHHDDDEAGTHRFVSRTGAAADRGVTGTAEDEGRADDLRESEDRSGSEDADVDIGGVQTEAGSDHDETGTATASDADWSLDDVSEGNTVIDTQGETVGIVTAVEADTLYVDPDPGITEKLSAKLGWVDEDDAEYTVDADDVAGIEDGDVHLKPVTL